VSPAGPRGGARAVNGAAVERVRAAYRAIAAAGRPEVWIDLRPPEEAEAEAAAVDPALPLAGRVAAVKGNIDVAGLPTTAGCPSYAYLPERDAPVVARLRAAGAVVLGTTNLDQFATGLVGTRSPYGAVRCAVAPDRVSGGSSSGSAVAVALGLVDVALGTDTAGSGRVPAAFNGIVGIKPTRGTVPTAGVVPACRSLDCVAVFARTLDEARHAHAVVADPDLPRVPRPRGGPFRIGVPPADRLLPLAPGWADAFVGAAARFEAAGARLVTVDPEPFARVARMLYEGAFVAERYTAVGEFIDAHAGSPDLDPTVAAIIRGARDIPAHRLFADLAELDRLRELTERQLAAVDALLFPTAPEHPTLAEVAADPVGVNSRLGRFTNCANLLDLCAIALPAATVAELPFGISLLGPAHTDSLIADIASLLPPGHE
jgi:allophanate hydrolase